MAVLCVGVKVFYSDAVFGGADVVIKNYNRNGLGSSRRMFANE
jgi:hypothetical protein